MNGRPGRLPPPSALRADHLIDIGRAEEARALLVEDPDTPSNAGALTALARALIKLDRDAEALEATEAALRVDPDLPSAHLLRALALLYLERPVDALTPARYGVRLAPGHYGSHQILARVLAGLGRFDEAHIHANRTQQLNPDGASGWITRSRVQLAQQRWHDAEMSARQALAADPESDEARVLLSLAQGNAGSTAKETEAMETLIDALRTNPDQRHVRALLTELALPRRLPIPIWLTILFVIGGAGAILLVLWAVWVGTRWYRTPVDVKRLVLADRSARWRIGLSLLGALIVIVFSLVVTVSVAVDIATGGGA